MVSATQGHSRLWFREVNVICLFVRGLQVSSSANFENATTKAAFRDRPRKAALICCSLSLSSQTPPPFTLITSELYLQPQRLVEHLALEPTLQGVQTHLISLSLKEH